LKVEGAEKKNEFLSLKWHWRVKKREIMNEMFGDEGEKT
jgi:hypothetical protein